MTELNALMIEEEIRKNYVLSENTKLFNIYKNKKNRSLLNFLMLYFPIENIIIGINSQSFYHYGLALLSLTAGYISTRAFQKIEIEAEILEKIRERIKTTDTYKNLENEYLSYITNLANYFKKIGMTSGITSATFYNILLDYGYLSKNCNHQYKVKENAIYEIPELMGSMVVTGESVCRHNACMLTDLENEIGNKAISLPVRETKNIEKDSKKKIMISNHLTSIIQDKKTKLVFGFCPSNREIFRIGTINQKIMLENINTKYLSFNVHDIATNSNTVAYNRRYLENIEAIFNDNIKEEKDIKLYFPTKEVKKISCTILSYLIENQKEIEEFYQQTKEQLRNIDSLLNQLYPREFNNKGKGIKKVLKYIIG